MSKSKSKSTNRAVKKQAQAPGDKLFSDFEAQPAQITDADKIDAEFVGLYDRRARRGALATLEKSGMELIGIVSGERDAAVAFAALSSAAEAYAKRLHLFAEMMDSASWRIRVALCNRADMASVLKDGEAALGVDEEPNGAGVRS